MSQKRKTAEAREKDLRLAMYRIKHGRSRTGTRRVTVSSVAREAGVSPALIHNHYAAIAEAIRVEQGRDSRAQRDAKHEQLTQEREKNRRLRREVETLCGNVARLSSINEVLLTENEMLRAKLCDHKVVPLKPCRG